MDVTAHISKILKNIQCDLIFDTLSESVIGFVSFFVVLAVENVVSFIKDCFQRKRGYITMRNYV